MICIYIEVVKILEEFKDDKSIIKLDDINKKINDDIKE